MKKQNINKKIKHIELIGCDYDNLKDHLTSLFKTYMTFDNYGEWELDHIQPISSFNLNIEAEFKACFHYTNIQPLWKSENRKKSNKSNYISEDNY